MRRLLLALALVGAGCSAPDEAPDRRPAAGDVAPGGSASRGEPPPPEVDLSRPLTVEECVDLALRRAPDLAAFEARVEAARAQVVTESTWPNPTLRMQALDMGDTDRALAQVQVTHPIFFAWTRGLREEVARAAADGARLDVDEERRLIAASVGEAFYDALAADALADSEREAAGTATELRALLGRRAALGDASLLDQERALAEELEARRLLDLALERREVARLLLAQLIGARRPDAILLAPGWRALEEPLGEPGDVGVADLVARAVERRSDARRARSREEQAELAQGLEERRALPLADVVASLGFRSGGPGNGGTFGLDVPLPLFDRNQGGRRRAAAELLGASAEVGRAARRVEVEVQTAFVACQRSRRRLLELAIPLAESRGRAVELARRLFEGGELGPTDLVLLERDAVGARRGVVVARRELAGARWRLRVAMGEAAPAP